MIFYRKCSIILFSILFFTNISFGQKQVISGKVTDEAGNPVAYATIAFKGSNQGGTMTQSDGSYRTLVPNGHDTIICTHINYNRKIETVYGNNIINIVLNRRIPEQTTIAVVGVRKYSAEELSVIKNKEKEVTDENDRVFTKVEINAMFAGGEKGFQKYLATTIIYPDSATISNVKGIVQVSFVVGKDGFVKNVALLKGINKYADEFVLQAITNMPKWIPAMQNGRYVDQYKEVSISFDIKGIE